MSRCVDPQLGVKVLSYDLLVGEEKAEVEQHLRVCSACRDLAQQTFGDAGALRELEWRAFRLSQRQVVPWHAWLGRRLLSLWLPFLLVLLGVGVLVVTLARRAPAPAQVRLVRLAGLRSGTLDSLAAVPVPRLSSALTSLVLEPDRDAIALVYEAGGGKLRRLIPGGSAAIPVLQAGAVHELALPELETQGAALLLVLAPSAAPRQTADWDQAVLQRVGPGGEGESAGSWPGSVTPTLRWLR